MAGGIIADLLIRSSPLSRTTVRKLLESVATFGTGAQLVLISFTACDSTHFLLLMAGVSLIYGIQAGGESPIVSDLTSRFSGTVFGISNSLAMSTSFIVPMVIGAILDHHVYNPRHAWHMVFYSLAALALAGGLVFLIFVKAEPQGWDWEEVVEEVECEKTETKINGHDACQQFKEHRL